MSIDTKSTSPSGESRRITLEALHALLEARRNDPDPKIANAIREYERIQQEISRVEALIPENDPVTFAVNILKEAATWAPVKKLAQELDARGIKSDATRKDAIRKDGSPGQKRPWTNVERLTRSLTMAVSHGTLWSYDVQEGGERVQYVGLPGFKYPAGVRRITATRKKR